MNENLNLKSNIDNCKHPLQGHIYPSQAARGYQLPMASEEQLGGVKAASLEETIEKTPVYIDKDGKLWTTSSGDKNFIYDQISLSTIWIIEHNLNKYPSVSVKDTGGNTYIGEVEYLGPNKLAVHFSVAISGRAYLN